MRYGAVLPGGTATEQLDQAVLAEQAGWDGGFVWEAAYGVDAWSLLAAIAVPTTRARQGGAPGSAVGRPCHPRGRRRSGRYRASRHGRGHRAARSRRTAR